MNYSDIGAALVILIKDRDTVMIYSLKVWPVGMQGMRLGY